MMNVSSLHASKASKNSVAEIFMILHDIPAHIPRLSCACLRKQVTEVVEENVYLHNANEKTKEVTSK